MNRIRRIPVRSATRRLLQIAQRFEAIASSTAPNPEAMAIRLILEISDGLLPPGAVSALGALRSTASMGA